MSQTAPALQLRQLRQFVKLVTKTANQTVSGVSLTDDTDLSFLAEANSTYLIEGVLDVTGPNLQLAIAPPAGSTYTGYITLQDKSSVFATAVSTTTAVSSPALFRVYVQTAATAGRIYVRHALAQANATPITVKAGSHITYQKL